MGGAAPEPDPDSVGSVRPELATAHPGRLEFAVRSPDGPGTRRIRCPDLGGTEQPTD